MNNNKRLVSAKILASRYAVAQRDIYKWTRCGVLTPLRLSMRCLRFDLEECDRLVGHRPATFTGEQNHGA